MIRPFELRDLPLLHRYREEGVYLDNVATLTWGRSLVAARAALSPLAAATGVFTSIAQVKTDKCPPLVAQVMHGTGASCARLTFLAPESAVGVNPVAELLDDLVRRVGERGAQNIVAEVDEGTEMCEVLRLAGFSVYARQRTWRFASALPGKAEVTWEAAVSRHEIPISSLYSALVPALVQQVEAVSWDKVRGHVCFQDGELMAYANLSHGPNGVWLQPFIHPDMNGVPAHLASLLSELGPRSARPIYICVRSYQAWLAQVLEDLGGEAGPAQALLVKRTTRRQKAAQSFQLRAIDGGHAEITTPLALPMAERGNDAIVISYDKTPNYG
ncbi:MAG: hypothetical protein OEZ02_15840 [Anaerolineae bacterium]|nr:hypothetical protein [Anaerolineae bacterium]